MCQNVLHRFEVCGQSDYFGVKWIYVTPKDSFGAFHLRSNNPKAATDVLTAFN